jgi:hypothetical protein
MPTASRGFHMGAASIGIFSCVINSSNTGSHLPQIRKSHLSSSGVSYSQITNTIDEFHSLRIGDGTIDK